MRRLVMFFAVLAAGAGFLAVPAHAAPMPPPPPVVGLPNGLLLGVSPYQGSGAQALDGSITASGTFFNFPNLGAGSYEYGLGPPEPQPVPGGKLRSGQFLLVSEVGSLSGDLLCNVALHTCLWQVLARTGGAPPLKQFFSNGQMKFLGRGASFTESGFFHQYSSLPTEA